MKLMSLEAAKELHSSQMWEGVISEIENLIQSELSKMKSCNKDDLEKHQLKIQCYEEMILLPEAIVHREEA